MPDIVVIGGGITGTATADALAREGHAVTLIEAGHIAAMADAPESVAGLVVAAGLSGHGFCLGPISGLLCADLALARPPRLDLSAFRLGRFRDKAIAAAELTLHG